MSYDDVVICRVGKAKHAHAFGEAENVFQPGDHRLRVLAAHGVVQARRFIAILLVHEMLQVHCDADPSSDRASRA